MKIKTLNTAVLAALCLTFVGQVAAQDKRPERTLYVLPRIGASNYLGDNDRNPFDFNDYKGGKLPYSAALELGYQFTPYFAIGGSYQIADYPTINGNESFTDYSRRHTANLKLRLTAGARRATFAPFLELGGGVSTGLTKRGTADLGSSSFGDQDLAFGPVGGLGFDVALNDRTSLILGAYTNMTFPDKAIDADDVTRRGRANRQGEFDFISHAGVGLKLNFRSAFTAVDVIAIDGPTTLETNQTGTFTATTNDDAATQPIEYRWDFGDGSTGTGLLATHAYTRAGTYTVTFNASNDGSMDMASMTVTVTNPPVPAAVISLTSNPAGTACANQPVSFTSNARGDAPVTYSWNFGDGGTGTGATASHTFTTPGTYTVTLNTSNASGSDSRTLTLTVNDCTVSDQCANITELNSAFFGSNSSTLTEAGRMALMENVEVLRGCPNLRVRLEGFAGPGERNAQQLAEDRARAVMQFYTDNGISAANMTMMGMGAAEATTSKKDDTSQFRRVDSIPVR